MDAFTNCFGGLLCFAVGLLAGCASPGTRTGEIKPAGFTIAAGQAISVRVVAADPDDSEDFAEDYAADLKSRIVTELLFAGFNSGESLELVAAITWIAPGGAWGEEAECHLDVTLTRGDGVWRFSVIGYSGSTWGRDRIPNALAQAAKAVADTLAKAKQ